MDIFFTSAADGTNVVKIFEESIKRGLYFIKEKGAYINDVLKILDEL